MKHLHTFEGKNTKDWYCKILSKNNTKETFFDFFYKIASNPEVEDIKMIELSSVCNFYVYITKSEKDTNFKNWAKQTDDSMVKLVNKYNYKEYNDVELEEWLDDWDMRADAGKYNI